MINGLTTNGLRINGLKIKFNGLGLTALRLRNKDGTSEPDLPRDTKPILRHSSHRQGWAINKSTRLKSNNFFIIHWNAIKHILA